MCQTHETHKDSHSGTNKHIYTIPEGDVGGDKELLCDNLSVNNITIWLHLSQRRNSEALPPTGLWGEGPTADGWADTGDGFLYAGCEYRSVTNLQSLIMLSFLTKCSKL